MGKQTMPAPIIDANPEVLAWARVSIGLERDAAAKKIGVDTLVLRYWEEGVETDDVRGPTLGQLRRMAQAYKRPLAALLLPEPPPTDNVVKADFRLLPQNQNKSWSPELRVALRRVQMQRSVAEELAEAEGETPPPSDLSIALVQNPEAVGESIRLWLGTPRRGTHESFLRQWIALIEEKNILVTQIQRVSLEEMRGCSISDQPFPAIILNGADSQNGKTFILMHELAHILLRIGGLCDLEDKRSQIASEKERIERFCNQVAAALLMPREDLLGHLRGRPVDPLQSAELLQELAGMYGVSREAMLLRLISLNQASWEDYAQMKPHFEEMYEKRNSAKENDKGGGPTYYTMKVRDFGRRYINTVLDAYYRQEITNVDLARYLNMKANKVADLEATMGAQR